MTKFKISGALLPDSGKDLERRKVFFATALGLECLCLLRQYIDHCYAEGEKHDPDPQVHRAAVKELLAISIWLTLLDQYDPDDFSESLKEFFVDCWYVADRLYPQPASQAVIEQYPADSALDTICLVASVKLAHSLSLGEKRQDAGIYLGGLLYGAREKRAQLLYGALTEPIERLNEVMDMYG